MSDEDEDEDVVEVPPLKPEPQKRQQRKKKELSLSFQEERLWNVLKDTNPDWSQREVLSALSKLKAIGVDSVSVLVDMLETGQTMDLNEQLKAKGKRPFAQRTLKALWTRVVSELPPERFMRGGARAEKPSTLSDDLEDAAPKWLCNLCGWENRSGAIVCNACEYRRPSLGAWQCLICRQQNEASLLKCQACLESRQRGRWSDSRPQLCDADTSHQVSENEPPAFSDFYELLGVEPRATLHEISVAYQERKFAALSSKGGGGGLDMLQNLKEAYQVLRDPWNRRVYDLVHGFSTGDAPFDGDAPAPAASADTRQEATSASPAVASRAAPEAAPKKASVRFQEPEPATPSKASPSLAPSTAKAAPAPAQEDASAVDYYRLLGVLRTASMEELLSAFQRRLNAEDVQGDPQKLSMLSEALSVLSDPKKRLRYDTAAAARRAAAAKREREEKEAQKAKQEAEGDLYGLVGVAPTALLPEILLAFQGRLATEDPAKGGDPRKLELLQRAFGVLTDPEKRREYDASRSSASASKAKGLAASSTGRAAGAPPVAAAGAGGSASDHVAAWPVVPVEPEARKEPPVQPCREPAPAPEPQQIDSAAMQDSLAQGAELASQSAGRPRTRAAIRREQLLQEQAAAQARQQSDQPTPTPDASSTSSPSQPAAKAAQPMTQHQTAAEAHDFAQTAQPTTPQQTALDTRAPSTPPKTSEQPPAKAEPLRDVAVTAQPTTPQQTASDTRPPSISSQTSEQPLPKAEPLCDLDRPAKEKPSFRPPPRPLESKPPAERDPDVPPEAAPPAPPAAPSPPAPAPPASAPAPGTGQAEPAPAPAPAAAEGCMWECKDCGHDNSPDALACFMCDTPRGGGVAGGGPPWECPDCRYDNPASALICGGCDTARGEDMVSAGAPWLCQGCSTDNVSSAHNCSGCGRGR